MAKSAAIYRLLRVASNYNVKLIKNERVMPGDMEINIHPSDYERHIGDILPDVFDNLSKTHMPVDTTGNVSRFLGMWRKSGFRDAVERVKQKYRLVSPDEKQRLESLERIDQGVSRLLEHFSIPRAEETGGEGPPNVNGNRNGRKGNGNGNRIGNGNNN